MLTEMTARLQALKLHADEYTFLARRLGMKNF
jgi:hypothetical protein